MVDYCPELRERVRAILRGLCTILQKWGAGLFAKW